MAFDPITSWHTEDRSVPALRKRSGNTTPTTSPATSPTHATAPTAHHPTALPDDLAASDEQQHRTERIDIVSRRAPTSGAGTFK